MNYFILNSLIDITNFTVQARQNSNYLVNKTTTKQHIPTTRNDSQCGYFDTLDRSFSVSGECDSYLWFSFASAVKTYNLCRLQWKAG